MTCSEKELIGDITEKKKIKREDGTTHQESGIEALGRRQRGNDTDGARKRGKERERESVNGCKRSDLRAVQAWQLRQLTMTEPPRALCLGRCRCSCPCLLECPT